MRCTPTSATARSAPRSTARSRRWCPSCERRRGRDHHLEGADRAAGGVGVDRRHRQGARRDPARDPHGGAHAICRLRPADGRAAVPARQEGLFRREAAGRAAAARARLGRRRDGGGRARRDAGLRRRARDVSGLQGGARRARSAAEAGERLVRAAQGEVADLPGAGRQGRRATRSRSAASSGDLPVRFAPNGGAVPGDRIVGIMTPGEGITIYPIQSPALKAVRGHAGALARRALGHRRGKPAALPGAHHGALGERAGHARADRAGDRRARRQHRQHPHDAARAGLHRAADRSRGLRPQAPQRDHRAAPGEGRGGAGRAGERVSAIAREFDHETMNWTGSLLRV